MKWKLMTALLVPVMAACGDSTGPEAGARVAVQFQAVTPVASGALGNVAVTGPLTLTGNGNTLVIQDLRLIVSELELERADGCDSSAGSCEEFEGGPYLVNLLDGSAAALVTTRVPPGVYEEFEFEVEQLEGDEDDDSDERAALARIRTELRQAYPQFPDNASMVVKGTYNGAPFTVYFNAEVEVEKEFAGGFTVPDDVGILVDLNPSAWFMKNGAPMNLAALNGRTMELEVEFESAVRVRSDD